MAGKGSVKGENNGGGRKLGSGNKPRPELIAMLREAYGPKFDAVVEMAEIAHRLKGDHDPEQELRRIKCLESIARYTRPQLKAIEHRGEITTRSIMDVDSLVARDAARSIAESIGIH